MENVIGQFISQARQQSEFNQSLPAGLNNMKPPNKPFLNTPPATPFDNGDQYDNRKNYSNQFDRPPPFSNRVPPQFDRNDRQLPSDESGHSNISRSQNFDYNDERSFSRQNNDNSRGRTIDKQTGYSMEESTSWPPTSDDYQNDNRQPSTDNRTNSHEYDNRDNNHCQQSYNARDGRNIRERSQYNRDRDRRDDRNRGRDRGGPRRREDRDGRERESRWESNSERDRSRDRNQRGRGDGDSDLFNDNDYRDSPSRSSGNNRNGDGERSRPSRFDRNNRPDYRGDYDNRGDRDERVRDWGREQRGGRFGHTGEGEWREKGGDKWMTEVPTPTILLRNLPQNIDEPDIRAELMLFGTLVKDVRLVRRKDTGQSRGFAFVEFQNVTDAQRWMDHNQGRLNMQDAVINMHFSSPKNRPADAGSGAAGDWNKADWICSKCGVHNFKRRDFCFKCNISREESDKKNDGDGFDQVGSNPCNTLIYRGLDALTTEETIMAALNQVTALPVKNIKVIRDDATGVSRGFAFSEMQSIRHSQSVLDMIQAHGVPFEVDGKAIIVSFAKNTYNTTMATLQAQQQQSLSSQQSYTGSQSAQSGYYTEDGKYYDPTSNTYYDYATGQYIPADKTSQSDKANAAAAVAQAAIQQSQAVKKQTEVASGSWSSNTSSQKSYKYPTADAKYPVPDVSTFTYEETSGYYYDAITHLYYDAGTQYFYDSASATFLYWDGTKQTYLPAPTEENNTTALGTESQQSGMDATGTTDIKKKEKDKEKKEKVKVAKKIAKDMEKWAKSMNAQKQAVKDTMMSSSTKNESASADAGFAVLEKRSVYDRKGIEVNLSMSADNALMPPPGMSKKEASKAGNDGLVASYGGDSDDEEEPHDTSIDFESRMLDYNKFACLLCRRQFPNKEALQRHVQLSDLHKQKVEEMKSQSSGGDGQYRDRAKERRQKFGAPAPPDVSRKRVQQAPVPFEQPTAAGLQSDNKGNRMLQNMGWSEGQGLGRSNQGIVDPVQARMRNQSAGLGSAGSNYNVAPGDSYKDSLKKVMYARYQELN